MANERSAGILLAITSLPSPYGIGDLGPQARKFADFLHSSKQKYWQVLPVNPISGGAYYSPYSSVSGMAGNVLLISPDDLVEAGYLEQDDLISYYTESASRVDYSDAQRIKESIFDKAFNNFLTGDDSKERTQFDAFCANEATWLHDFALFMVIKQSNSDAHWEQWPDVYKNRNEQALKIFASQNDKPVQKVKWLQYIFFQQWTSLKQYCNNLNVSLFGDMPFYASYDAADVWANRKYFSIDSDGNRTGVAGVPPDYFSVDGQLWGMPTFNWEELKLDGYQWWIQRLKKSLELFDLLRLDHFRAFDEYWEIPADAETAKTGEWRKGPGIDFFDTINEAMGILPFVAEDLGDRMESVFLLRDKINLPGMKILQFAFGDNLALSSYAPHNYISNFICYTGTHDNNTVVGWYQQDVNDQIVQQLNLYTGLSVTESNVHIVLGRLAYTTVAKMVILPMQDVLGLGATERMNKPSTIVDNWQWRLLPNQVTDDIVARLRLWTEMYNRG